MSKTPKIKVDRTTNNDSLDVYETAVYLVDEKGEHVGVAILKTKPGMTLHYKFENTIKLMIK